MTSLNPKLTLPSIKDALRYIRPRSKFLQDWTDDEIVTEISRGALSGHLLWSVWFDGSMSGIVVGHAYRNNSIFVSILVADSIKIVHDFVNEFNKRFPSCSLYGKRHGKIKLIKTYGW